MALLEVTRTRAAFVAAAVAEREAYVAALRTALLHRATYSELSKAAGVSRSSVHRMLNEEPSCPTTTTT